ncbi:glycosyltransferase family 4 protein [Devosia sp. FJ2-5-3]|uniref:glycosyltransferase family 4 protein n=1 Tax=Devosia sp. FJ2-5-3 TaxID=2976680 RepID=UPI0023D7C25D|nr:glycosyltransferase family 4 protein [Devosia sp. FJ2-5-3]WEJ56961.1 glycosyltransferase family 4 protein [Devosia sp. FJ2-5-3]
MRPVLVLATDSLEPSGLGTHMVTLGRSLVDHYDIVIACQDDESGLAFLGSAARWGLRIKSFSPGDLQGFRRWLKTSEAALLHVHAGIGWEGHDLVRLGKAAGLPVLRTEHLPYLLTSKVQQAEYAAMLLSVDRVIAVSQDVAHTYADSVGWPRIAVIPNGIVPPASSHASRATVRAELGLDEIAPLVLTVARFTTQKDYASLLRAVPQVLLQHPEARFVFVGDGPERECIAESVFEAGLERSVTLLGRREDVPELLAAADLFVLPSLFEGLPLVLLEAMAVGVPIVGTAVAGIIEAVGRDHAFLVEAGDSMLLAATIGIALGDTLSARVAADAARSRFLRHFQADRMAKQTSVQYADLLAASLLTSQALIS